MVNQFFDSDAPVIFAGNFFNTVSQLWSAKYAAAPLEAALQKMLGDLTLADCKTNFLATSYDYATNRLVFFKSYEPSFEDDNCVIFGPDSGIKLWQVLRATSAAQSYFPAYEYNAMVLMDGGNTGDNAPDMLIFTEAQKFAAIPQNLMLSVGAGNSKWDVTPKTMADPSVITAGVQTINITFSAGETNSVMLTRKNLGGNYYRLVADLGEGYKIDDASPATFAAITAAWQTAIAANPAIYQLFSS